ncbi:MAG TPA: DUF4139 domain-containing protein [Rhodanobacteraceae bacterium]|nr:DUF4139 domain-containing protein [Rhodanobacteraceae bacterium]
MSPSLLFATIAVSLAAPAGAADSGPSITLYRGDSAALFEGGGSPVAEGYAVIHERRAVTLDGGRRTVVIDGLPSTLDPEAVAVDLGGNARILARRVLAAGDDGLLDAHRGERVSVFAADGKLIVDGSLLGLDGANLGVRAADGTVNYVRDYARVQFPDGSGAPGSTLQLIVDGGAGTTYADLTYPTSGLGWRAAYTARLLPGDDCRLRLDALASIANRSGRDFSAAHLKLIAGEPNFAKPSAPQPVMMKARAYSAAAPEALPEQTALGDYRSYAIDATLDLPDSSVNQVPLYAPAELACARTWVVEYGGGWTPPKPMITDNGVQRSHGPVSSQLAFTAGNNLPAGYLRVLTRGDDGRGEFLGEGRVGDTPRGQKVELTLGTAFDITAARERTLFDVDQAAHEMSEGFRVDLANAGETARTITVREHPNRWRNWSLSSSSVKPSRQAPDLLEFRVEVPAGGKAVLDYAVHYHWTGAEQ